MLKTLYNLLFRAALIRAVSDDQHPYHVVARRSVPERCLLDAPTLQFPTVDGVVPPVNPPRRSGYDWAANARPRPRLGSGVAL